nr:leucine-rich repeat protein [uncultured Sphaerochaeta sp.]
MQKAKLSIRSIILLQISFLVTLLLIISCSPPDITEHIIVEDIPTESYNLYFYLDNEIVVEKIVEAGSIIGEVVIPDIDTEQYIVQWYDNSLFYGSPIDLANFVIDNEQDTTFYASITPIYLDITINKNNGEDPIQKRVYSTIFNEPDPQYLNYQVVPGRFTNLIFDGWYIDGKKIYTYNEVLYDHCNVYAGWKLPSGSSSWEATSIRVPNYITTLDDSAFENWTELEVVIFDEGSNLKKIGKKAFSNTKKLKSISIPDSVIEIGDAAFKGSLIEECIITNDSELSTIGKQAFYSTNIKSINLPNNLRHIKEEAFCACFSLEDVLLDHEDSQLSIIGKYAFSDTAITAFTIPSSVTTIEGGAFSSCTKLSHINVNSLNTIFRSLDGILCEDNTLVAWPDGKASTIIPEGIREIKEYAFGYSSIDSIQLPDTLLNIGNGTFEYSKLIHLDLPDSVEVIENNAFFFSALQDCHISANSKLTSIGSRAFYMTKISEFIMPPNIMIVGPEAFLNRYLSKISFHEGITIIGDYFNFVYTSSITLPDSVNSIVSNAFPQNTELFTNKTSLDELSEYGLSENQINRYVWKNKTTKEILK